jgi:tRNA 2-selenouridine synthase
VLDLETLAAHRGSVLGNLPETPQPSQKMFESRIWSALRAFSPARPIYVEAESKRIGNLRVPDALIEAMWRSPCVLLEAPIALRIALLKDEYAHFMAEPDSLLAKLDCLASLYGHAAIAEWKQLAREGRWDRLAEALLLHHYDPAYTRSTLKHYGALGSALKLTLGSTDADAFRSLARQCLAQESAP